MKSLNVLAFGEKSIVGEYCRRLFLINRSCVCVCAGWERESGSTIVSGRGEGRFRFEGTHTRRHIINEIRYLRWEISSIPGLCSALDYGWHGLSPADVHSSFLLSALHRAIKFGNCIPTHASSHHRSMSPGFYKRIKVDGRTVKQTSSFSLSLPSTHDTYSCNSTEGRWLPLLLPSFSIHIQKYFFTICKLVY